MTRPFGGETIWFVDLSVPFTFDGHLFARGGVIVLFENGKRTAVTREHFSRWF